MKRMDYDDHAADGLGIIVLVVFSPLILAYCGAKLCCAVIGWSGFAVYDAVLTVRERWGRK